MPRPTPIIAPVSDILASALPIASLGLDGSGSTPSTGGSSITDWLWTLESKPPGSAASLQNPTTATPNLLDIDTIGTYLVSLWVRDDTGAESHAGIYPVQATTAPFDFTFPVPTQVLSVRVLTTNADLVKVAEGERSWLARGLWELVDEVDLLRGDVDGIMSGGISGDVYTDNIFELTTSNGIDVHHPVRLNDLAPRTGSKVVLDGDLEVDNVIHPANATVSGAGDYVIDAAGISRMESVGGATVRSTGGTATLRAETVALVRGDNGGAELRAVGAHPALVRSTAGPTEVRGGTSVLVRSDAGSAVLQASAGDAQVTSSTGNVTLYADDEVRLVADDAEHALILNRPGGRPTMLYDAGPADVAIRCDANVGAVLASPNFDFIYNAAPTFKTTTTKGPIPDASFNIPAGSLKVGDRLELTFITVTKADFTGGAENALYQVEWSSDTITDVVAGGILVGGTLPLNAKAVGFRHEIKVAIHIVALPEVIAVASAEWAEVAESDPATIAGSFHVAPTANRRPGPITISGSDLSAHDLQVYLESDQAADVETALLYASYTIKRRFVP